MTPQKRYKSDSHLGLSTLQDISTLILHSHDLDETLDNIVELVAQRAHSDVCSLYLLEDDETTLVLRATHGLDLSANGTIRMKVGEGLTGKVVEEQRFLAISEPQNHPQYRYFEGTGEERFHTYFGIPLFDRGQAIGALVVQTRETHELSDEERATLTTIAFQVASIVVNARLLNTIDRFAETDPASSTADSEVDMSAPDKPHVLSGQVAYPGVIIAAVNLIDQHFGFADVFDECNIEIETELQRLDEALRKTRIETLYLERKVAERLTQEDAAIFHTHLMILEDRGFIERLHELIERRHSAPYALKKVIAEYLAAFSRMEDLYLRERAADMEDIGRRLLGNLVGRTTQGLHLHHAGILVAQKLLPSDMAILNPDMIQGIILEANEANSHSVIMAKALGIPALIGVKNAVSRIDPTATIILDANSGCVFLNPTATITEEYQRLEQDRLQEQKQLSALRDIPAVTRDGQRIELRANIGLVSDVYVAQQHGAEGVGLYRTEFPYMARSSFPDREDQYQLYKKLVEDFAGQPVTIRTLDIGGDKVLPYFNPPREDNPFMGWRSVRVSLDQRDIFQTQIEAILMAATHGSVRLLFPMISTINEIQQCKEIVRDARGQLTKEGLPCVDSLELGAMIEVPAAIHLAPHLAKEVDFFALGTNDLVQYMLAVDRANPRVQGYYEPLHPAVLLALDSLAETARRHQIDLCICGEMPSDPAAMVALIGLRIYQYSLAAPCIPRLKRFISRIDTQAAEQLARQILQQGDAQTIRQTLEQALELFPEPLY